MQHTPSFGRWLKERRRELDIRQEQLASRVGCSVVALQKLESEERRPSRQLAELLARELAVPVDERPLFVRFARQIESPQPLVEILPGNAHAPWRSLYRASTNVPSLPGTLFGRDSSLQSLAALLERESVRLVTLYGPPGVGKTSMALAVSPTLLSSFDDGVFLVELAHVANPDSVVFAILRSLQIVARSQEPPVERLMEFLQSRRTLLILDNFEHVLPASALIRQLLAHCPWLTILVTSRVILHLRGERRVLVEPLSVPPLTAIEQTPASHDLAAMDDAATRYDAVLMFVDHAYAGVTPEALAPAVLQTICVICAYLGGLPLAIELAAAHTALLSPVQILEDLKAQQRVLANGPHDLPTRHQSLERAIESSYRLLTVPAQHLLQILSLFRRGATADAVTYVAQADFLLCGASIAPLLETLVAHNLIRPQTLKTDQQRYIMLEPIREDTARRLSQHPNQADIFARFLSYYVQLAADSAEGLDGKDELAWLALLDDEFVNMKAAVIWALDHGRSDAAARISAPIWRYWTVRGLYSLGSHWLERILKQCDLCPKDRADVMLGLAELLSHLGAEERAHALLQDSLRLYRSLGEDIGAAYALWELHWRSRTAGLFEQAREQLQDALQLFVAGRHMWGQAAVLGDLGSLAMVSRQYEQAAQFFAESLDLAKTLANPSLLAICYNNSAWLARERDETALAHSMTTVCLSLAQQIGNRSLEAVQLYCQALTLARQQNYQASVATIEVCITVLSELSDQRWLAHSLTLYGDLLWIRGSYERAEAVIADACALYEGCGDTQGLAGALQSAALLKARQRQFLESESAVLRSLEYCVSTQGGLHNTAHALVCCAYLVLEQGAKQLACRVLWTADELLAQYDGKVEPYLRFISDHVRLHTQSDALSQSVGFTRATEPPIMNDYGGKQLLEWVRHVLRELRDMDLSEQTASQR